MALCLLRVTLWYNLNCCDTEIHKPAFRRGREDTKLHKAKKLFFI